MLSPFSILQKLQANVNPQQGGHIRPQRNFQEWLNEINQELFEELARQWEKNGVISDKLRPFLKSVNITLVPQPGLPHDTFLVPADYRYFSSARFLFGSDSNGATGQPCATCCTVDGATGKQVRYVDPDEAEQAQIQEGSNYRIVRVRKIDNQRWDSCMAHVFKMPTIKEPKVTGYDGGFKVAPRGLGLIVLDYLRPPKDCKFAYTIGPDDQIIYDANASDELEWDTNVLADFLSRLEIRYGAYVREEFTYQAGQLKRVQTKS